MPRRLRSQGFKRAVVAVVWTALVVPGLSACGGEASVVIRNGVNAGKKYSPGLVGGLTLQQCLQQSICVKR